jgi:hypothetical protein
MTVVFESARALLKAFCDKLPEISKRGDLVGIRVDFSTGAPRIIVTIRGKADPPPGDIPRTFEWDRIDVDVRVFGLEGPPPECSGGQGEPRPPPRLARTVLSMGDTVSHGTGDGTLGWIFADQGGTFYLVSNWHVLCGDGNRSILGQPIFSTSGTSCVVARLSAFEPRQEDVPNTWDLAFGRVLSHVEFTFRDCPKDRTPFGRHPTHLSTDIEPCGHYHRLSSATGQSGRLLGVGRYTLDGCWFEDQLFFDAIDDSNNMGSSGSSGSVIVHARTNTVTGLAMAHTMEFTEGGDEAYYAIANPLFTRGWETVGLVDAPGHEIQLPVLRCRTALHPEPDDVSVPSGRIPRFLRVGARVRVVAAGLCDEGAVTRVDRGWVELRTRAAESLWIFARNATWSAIPTADWG